MARRYRIESPTGYYHVMQRGTGKQILFEDTSDYERYLAKLLECITDMSLKLCAFCLMNNHVHLLIYADSLDQLSRLMQRVGRSYAGYYNSKYDHVGYVFQDRYLSEPINDESYLLACVRYIHNNPVKAGFGQRDEYRWSSYGEYSRQSNQCGMVDTELVMSCIGGHEQFEKFSQSGDDKIFVDVEVDASTCAMGQEIIRKHFGNEFESTLKVKQLRVEERNQIILEMKQAGMNSHQIELVTGVSRRIVRRVVA